jgi:hypothetical protein
LGEGLALVLSGQNDHSFRSRQRLGGEKTARFAFQIKVSL